MKVNTISLNSVRLNTIALNHIGEIRSGGGGSKPSPIPQWIREHIVFYYDVKKQGATNETLKESAYLQDLSGKGRRMKLNNFLFAEMSGAGGYNDNFNNWELKPTIGTVDRISSEQVIIRKYISSGSGVMQKAITNNKRVFLKCNIEGITEGVKGKIMLRYHTEAGYRDKILENGYFEFDSNIETDNTGYAGFVSTEPIDNCNITITQIPEYPGALVTDGVDNYGLVENLSSGVKMLFMTVNPIGNFNSFKNYYSQMRNAASQPFCVYSTSAGIAYNYSNFNGITYIDGVLNESIGCTKLWGLKHTITIVNDTVNPTNSGQPAFFSREEWRKGYYSKIAFYNSIAFDSIPTEADGFTEQELIDYVLTNIIGQ